MSLHSKLYFVPKQLEHTHTSSATTYHFRPQVNDRRFLTEWALCTVNDTTAELTVCSDWGNFTHRWSAHPDHLGAPTLTHFIARRNSAQYLTDKLTAADRKLQRGFSPEKTIRYLCRTVGHSYRDGNIDKIECRRRIDALREMLSHAVDDERDFTDRVYAIGAYDKITSEPWEYFQYEETTAYLVLLHAIVPALILACTETIVARSALSISDARSSGPCDWACP